MHEAWIPIARMIALAHDHWRAAAGRRRPLSGKVAVLEEQAQRLRAECDLLRARMQRIRPMRRPHYRRNERLEILWHAARYRLSIAAIRGAPAAAFAIRMLRRAMRQNDIPRWLVSDKDPVLRARTVQRLLTRHGILRRYGAVGKSGSIGLIERFWRSMKEEYVRPLFLYRSTTAIDGRLDRYRTWFNQERPHQGQRQRTPDDVYFARSEPTRDRAGGMLHVWFHDGDRRLPVLRLRDAA